MVAEKLSGAAVWQVGLPEGNPVSDELGAVIEADEQGCATLGREPVKDHDDTIGIDGAVNFGRIGDIAPTWTPVPGVTRQRSPREATADARRKRPQARKLSKTRAGRFSSRGNHDDDWVDGAQALPPTWPDQTSRYWQPGKACHRDIVEAARRRFCIWRFWKQRTGQASRVAAAGVWEAE